ncbi:hypothetical protein QVD99_001140 [Batrachochytrium dendrobatidis]|nr:hypothetical protein O5D80_001067 [Batrachochytrium dendrobatidis]KAK5672374.1 hypothetical protein QVD99_001140 [Batrachochytrium dendrobatidis]
MAPHQGPHSHGHSHHDHDHSHGLEGHVHNSLEPLDACASEISGNYDLKMHIASIFIIMLASFIGTLLPILGKRFIRSDTGKTVITFFKLFGAGVILSTALVHMFLSSVHTLVHPCLPSSFTDFTGFAAVFAMVGIFLTHLVQVFASHAIRKHQKGASHSLDKSEIIENEASTMVNDEVIHHEGHTHGGALMYGGEKQLVVYLLELGIASHSIIIGLTLGVATDEFTTLLIALCFHQFFEGVALSAIVTEANFKRWAMTIYMAVFYTFATPIGIALGVGLYQSYNANATQTLLSTGILDALSAGILIYDVLVNIIYPHFNANSFHAGSAFFKMGQLVALYLGAAAMSVIGLWA